MEIRIVHDTVGFSACRTADIIYNAVFLVDLTAGQRRCPGIAVVVAREEEIDAGRFNRLRKDGLIRFSAACRIGIINRYMRYKDLPVTFCGSRIFYQPLFELLQLIPVLSMVQHRDVDVSVLHGVPVAGQIEHTFRRHGIVAVVVRLMIAYHMENICVCHALHPEKAKGSFPLVIITDIVNGIAGLDSQIILIIFQDICNIAESGKRILLLNIRQKKQFGTVLPDRCGKGTDFRPDCSVAHLEIIGCSRGKSHKIHGIHTAHDSALAVGNQGTDALSHLRVCHVLVQGQTDLGAFFRMRRTADPGNIFLRSSILCDIKMDILRRAVLAGCFIAADSDHVGTSAIGIHTVQCIRSGRSRQIRSGQRTVFSRSAKLLIIIVINIQTRRRLVSGLRRDNPRHAHYQRAG